MARASSQALILGCVLALGGCSAAQPAGSTGTPAAATPTASPPTPSPGVSMPAASEPATIAPTEPPGTASPTPSIGPEVPGSIAAFCALLAPAAIESMLGAPVADQRIERSGSGGASCSYSSGNLDAGEGTRLWVSIDRLANLQRSRPGWSLDAPTAYEQRLAAISAGVAGQELDGMGLAAWTDGSGSLLALLAPDFLVELLFDPAAGSDLAIGLVDSVATTLAVAVPSDPGPVPACRLLSYDAIQAFVGASIDGVIEYELIDPLAGALPLPFGGASLCEFVGLDAEDPFLMTTIAYVGRYRTEDLRAWLMSEESIGIATDEQRAAAASMTAAEWVGPFFSGEPASVTGACAATRQDNALHRRIGLDDVVILQLPAGADQDVLDRLARRAVASVEQEVGGPANCAPLGLVESSP